MRSRAGYGNWTGRIKVMHGTGTSSEQMGCGALTAQGNDPDSLEAGEQTVIQMLFKSLLS